MSETKDKKVGRPTLEEKQAEIDAYLRRPKVEKKKRVCLNCRKEFQSRGIHNRLCASCQDPGY